MSVLDRRAYVQSESRPSLSLTGRMVEQREQQACCATWAITLPQGEAGRLVWRMEPDGRATVQALSEEGSQVWLRGEGRAQEQIIDGLLHVQASAITARGEARLVSVYDALTLRLLYAWTTAADRLEIGGGCCGQPE